MARPIEVTPSLRGKTAEKFIMKLENEKNMPIEIVSKNLDISAIKELAFAIPTNIKK